MANIGITNDDFTDLSAPGPAQAAPSGKKMGITDADLNQGDVAPPVKPTTWEDIYNKADEYAKVAARGANQALPFANDIGSGIEALSQGIPSNWGDFKNKYAERLKANEKQLAEDESEHPYVSYGSGLAAGLAVPVGGAGMIAERLAPTIGKGLATAAGTTAMGAGYGGLYGAGHGDDIHGRLSNAGTGAMVGAGLGAAFPLVSGAISSGVNRASSLVPSLADRPAGNVINGLIAGAGPGEAKLSASDALAGQAQGQPTMVGDLGGEALRRAARWAANTSPQAAGDLRSALAQRSNDQSSRFSSFLKDTFGSDLNNDAVRQEIKQRNPQIVTPAYEAAFRDPSAQSIWNPDLERLIQSPDVASAINSANGRAVNDAILRGDPQIVRNPFAADANGNVSLATQPDGSVATPNLRYWNQVKIALSDASIDAGHTAKGAELGRLASNLSDTLDAAVPIYASARAEAASRFGANDALTAGSKFLGVNDNESVNATLRGLQSLPPGQREVFAQGFGGAIMQKALTPGVGRNVVNLFNSPAFQQKAEAVLGPQRAAAIKTYLDRENVMEMLKTKVMGNSTTEEQQGDRQRDMMGMLGKLFVNPLSGAIEAGGIEYARSRDPVSALKAAAAGAALGGANTVRMRGARNLANSVAEKLVSNNPADINDAVRQVSANPAWSRVLGTVSQWAGNNANGTRYARGGSVSGHKHLVDKLIKMAAKAQEEEKMSTKHILRAPDDSVTAALAKANEAV